MCVTTLPSSFCLALLHCIPCIDVLVASVALTLWCWGSPGCSSGAPYLLRWSLVMDLFLNLDWNGLPCMMVLKGVFASILAAQGMFWCVLWWFLFSSVPWGFFFCPWRSSQVWGLVCQLPGSESLGLDLATGAGLAPHGTLSLSQVGAFSETKLKASFSGKSCFAVLALIQSSKVLKGIALLTSCSMSWKETFFLPDLPMVLKEVFLLLLWTVPLTLSVFPSSLVTVMLSTVLVLEGVSVHVHLALVLTGVGRWSWKDLGATLWILWYFAIYSDVMVLKGISGVYFCAVFYHWNRLRDIFA